MKSAILGCFAMLMLLVSFQVQAKKIEGTVFFEHDTIDMVLHIPTRLTTIRFEKLEEDVAYYNKEGKRVPLSFSTAKQIRFKFNEELIILRAVAKEWRDVFPNKKFVRLESGSTGAAQLCSYTELENDWNLNLITQRPTMGDVWIKRYFIVKNNVITKVPDNRFKRFIRGYFGDCASLIKKVEDKVLSRKYLGSIVDYYNSSCH